MLYWTQKMQIGQSRQKGLANLLRHFPQNLKNLHLIEFF